MNLVQFIDPFYCLCPIGAVIASWSLTQEMAGSSPFTVMTNILSLNSVNIKENSINNCIILISGEIDEDCIRIQK